MKIEITQQSFYESLKYFCDELNKIIEQNNNINSIVSNGNICSILQDSVFYLNDNVCTGNADIIYDGNYNGLSLLINKFQRWDDNVIYLKNNDEVIQTIQLVDDNKSLI